MVWPSNSNFSIGVGRTNANGWMGLNATSGTPYGNGTGNQAGRIDIAVAPSNSNYIYAQVQSITSNPNSGCGNASGCQLGAYRSTGWRCELDADSRFARLGAPQLHQRPGRLSPELYDQGIAVDPNNPDRVFFDTYEIWFWANGNPTWNDTTCGYGANRGVHVDQHALAFVPGSSSILLAGNDGGIHGTTNANTANSTVKPTWFNMDTGLNTIEFYSGDISANFATSAAPQANAGAQDNGSMSVCDGGVLLVYGDGIEQGDENRAAAMAMAMNCWTMINLVAKTGANRFGAAGRGAARSNRGLILSSRNRGTFACYRACRAPTLRRTT